MHVHEKFMHVTTISEKEDKNLKERKEGVHWKV